MDYFFLSNTVLFRGVRESEIQPMLNCLNAYTKKYGKGETVYREGTVVREIGLLLSGSVHVEQNDIWGNRAILGSFGRGNIFAEAYACTPGEPLMISVTAAEDTDILFMDTRRVLTTCSSGCKFHHTLIQNLLYIMAEKNLNLTRKITHITPKSIRNRLLSYLSFQSRKQGSFDVAVPFNRQQLADYLCVDRSALSNELGKMQGEGLLSVEKNTFHLIRHERTVLPE
ncbi:Crp/Fnr family transcriptional regulator [Treponema brennaborense]|uniref:Transcriptional regulator, Crp/Fnr family n=1 Tax=Treponema brennaborense (strain DSM 12168 / CIP 105900 / DD5/3) TaxID=906968 RepID=F4LNG4_TREBD|nr:Crp/Fnr family transcriptional regulator [Treponema brennaborense]AEE17922.1 transcriptional regulator, Crp/Fnr family [Treponema brennaborense DSM 12168]